MNINPLFPLSVSSFSTDLLLSSLTWYLETLSSSEENRSKTGEQTWKNIWAENGRDICQEDFPTGLTSATAQRSGYQPKMAT